MPSIVPLLLLMLWIAELVGARLKPHLWARFAFLPLGRSRRIELNSALRLHVTSPRLTEAAYRENALGDPDLTRLPWTMPEDDELAEYHAPSGGLMFATVRLKLQNRRMPGVIAIRARFPDSASVQLKAAYLPVPVSLVVAGFVACPMLCGVFAGEGLLPSGISAGLAFGLFATVMIVSVVIGYLQVRGPACKALDAIETGIACYSAASTNER